jgi:hypothetical protein
MFGSWIVCCNDVREFFLAKRSVVLKRIFFNLIFSNVKERERERERGKREVRQPKTQNFEEKKINCDAL